MKFACDACHTPYTIADDKVGARGIKLQCKKCAAILVVRPTGEVSLLPGSKPSSPLMQVPEPALSAATLAPSETAKSPDASNDPTADVAASLPSREEEEAELPPWYVAVEGQQDGPMSQKALAERIRAGQAPADALVWRQGLADWQVLGSCIEFESLFEALAVAGEQASASFEGPPSEGAPPVAALEALAAAPEGLAAALEAPAAAPEAPAAAPEGPAAAPEGPAAALETPAAALEAPTAQPKAPAVEFEAFVPAVSAPAAEAFTLGAALPDPPRAAPEPASPPTAASATSATPDAAAGARTAGPDAPASPSQAPDSAQLRRTALAAGADGTPARTTTGTQPWRPGAASELAALAARETQLRAAADVAPGVRHPVGPDDVLEGQLGLDAGPRPPTGPAEMIGSPTQWQLPQGDGEPSRWRRATTWVGLLLLSGLLLGGLFALRRSHEGQPPTVAAPAPDADTGRPVSPGKARPAAAVPPAAPSPTLPVAVPSPSSATPSVTPPPPALPSPAAAPSAAAVPPVPAAPAAPAPSPAPRPAPAAKASKKGRPPSRARPALRRPAARAARPAAPTPAAAVATAALRVAPSRADIVGVLAAHGARLSACVRAARGRGELAGSNVRLLVDWVITPGGEVGDPQLHSPDEPLSAALTTCVQATLSACRFTPSQVGAPVHNYPLSTL